ncbi:MYC [Lepeophtheirus salmonis]|uniref:MYC n=1 Tax=Lepeophtheirus salmonis TaxID=72036 RepID=A0A7R8H6P5_LEPSM|nr:MYC [Lepeophtheirus salmonis]CAF2887246.1 MYC [Lepeophtheirus salmonis]
MSLGNPLDPCIQDYEDYIKKEFAVVEELFTPAFEVEETKLWCKEEDEEDQLGAVPELDDLMDTSEASPDVIIPDLFQDLADLNSSDFFEEFSSQSKDSLSDVESFLGPCPTLEEEDGLRSDIMWSSACLNEELPISSSNHNSSSSKRPRRDSTLSLMECAQNLFRDFELSGFPLMDTPLPSSEDDDEEEIDVVSFEQHKHHHHAKPSSNNTVTRLSTVRTNPGRSLLKSQQQPPIPVMDHGFGDHSYHSVVQPNAASAPMGILTPTETVQSLIKAKSPPINTSSPNSSSSKDNVKFKFRMKFKSNNSTSSSPSSSNSSSSDNSLLRTSCKRKSASNNTYCPPPPSTPTKSSASRNLNESFSKSSSPSSLKTTSSSKRSSHGGGGHNSCNNNNSGNNNNSSSRHSISEAKCREVRDLHNSMERQRRVDLRNNFDQLKVVVPELKDAEKASKLNILNKSAEYCKYLTSTDIRLRKEKEQLMNRNAALTQRLSQLRNVVDRKYQQHRLTEKKRSSNTATSSTHPQPIRTLA